MKPDDRDIICEQDYTPLSNAELVTQIEENLEWLRGASLFDTERVMGPVRALLARAEAAEARVAELEAQLASDAADENQWLDAYIESAAKDGATIKSLMARAAELESQLAAQQWRPVTEDWPPYNERVIIGHGGGYDGGWFAFARRVRADNRNEDDWLMDDDTLLAFESAVVAMPRPLPPAPQETE